MRKLLSAVALAALALAAPAIGLAQIWVDGDDVVGIFTATDATARCNLDIAVGGPTLVYLCLINCTEPSGVSGWELKLEHPATWFILETQLAGQAVNAGTPPDEFLVGLANPLPQASVIRLATFNIFAGTDEVYFYIHPLPIPSVPGAVIYAAGDNPGNFTRMKWPNCDDEANPVFGFNSGPLTPCTVAREDVTWGAVRTLYE